MALPRLGQINQEVLDDQRNRTVQAISENVQIAQTGTEETQETVEECREIAALTLDWADETLKFFTAYSGIEYDSFSEGQMTEISRYAWEFLGVATCNKEPRAIFEIRVEDFKRRLDKLLNLYLSSRNLPEQNFLEKSAQSS